MKSAAASQGKDLGDRDEYCLLRGWTTVAFGSVQWNKLVVRAQKTMCHKLPPHYLQAKLDSFISFVREELSEKDDDSASHTANTDQVPLTFDIPLG